MSNNGWFKEHDEKYHTSHRLSAHGLLDFEKSPYRYWLKYIKGDLKEKPTPAMQLGTLFHKLALEPDDYFNSVLTVESSTRTTVTYKEALKKLPSGKTLILEDENKELINMVQAVHRNPIASKFLKEKGIVEHAGFFEIDGVKMRMKPDKITDNHIIDIKTSSDPSLKGFGYSADKYGYLFQAAFYMLGSAFVDGIKRKDFFIIVVENSYPYEVAIYEIGEHIIEKELQRFSALLTKYKKCLEESRWPGIGEEIKPIWLTNYYFERMYEK